MLLLSSTPGHALLMNLAERLLQDPQSEDRTCVDLVRTALSEKGMDIPKTGSLQVGRTTSNLRIAKLLLDRNLLREAEALLADVDDQAYVACTSNRWQIVLFLRILIRLGQPGRALNLLSSIPLDDRIDPSSRAQICLRIAEDYLNRNQLNQARVVMDQLDPVHIQDKVHLANLYGKLGYFDRAAELMEKVYAKDEGLQDGYSRLGWTRAKAGDWPGALKLMTKDLSAGRSSPPWQVNSAQAYGNLGFFEKAEQLVAQAYAKDSSLHDGYARLGWIRVVGKYRDLNKAFRLMAKDRYENRMSAACKKQFALLTALLGKVEEACGIVEEAYAENLNLCDAYGHIGWGVFLRNHDKEQFREWIERDRRLNRFSIQGKIFEANCLAAAAATNDVVCKVEEVYRENPAITDIFAGIGWHFFRAGDAETCCELMCRDWIEGKMNAHWLVNYAAALSAAGRCLEAQRILADAWAVNPHEERVVLGFPVHPDAVMPKTRFKALLSEGPGFKELELFHTSEQK
jgi:tetratricopeptide (TPR) repeat protein